MKAQADLPLIYANKTNSGNFDTILKRVLVQRFGNGPHLIIPK